MLNESNSQTFSLFYITCPDLATAQKISSVLLNQKLIACANILPGMQSMYHWQGELKSESEVVLILKSQSQYKTSIEEVILSHHPYDCPCLLQLPIIDGHQGFLQWISEATKGAQ